MGPRLEKKDLERERRRLERENARLEREKEAKTRTTQMVRLAG